MDAIHTFARALALAALATLAATPAHANHLEDVCTRSDSPAAPDLLVHIPATIDAIGRDVQIGEAYGPWFSYTITWTCQRKAVFHPGASFNVVDDYFEARTRYYPEGGYSPGMLAADPSFRVYRHGDLGFIVRITQQIDDQPAQITPLTAQPSSVTTTAFKGNQARQPGDTSKFHFTVEVRLVKVAPIPPLHALPLVIFNNFDTLNRELYANGSSYKYWIQRSHVPYLLKASINHVQGACQTPDQTVLLGDALIGSQPAASALGPLTGFNLRFEKCPPHLGSIDYQLQPVHGLAGSPAGTLRPDPATSTATGAGVQVLLEDGITPITFNHSYPLTAYDPHNTTPGTVYLVPLQARIVRTDGALTGGTVEAAMKIVATYR